MAFFLYASFPNSRNKLRSPTNQANTFQVTLSDYTQPLTRIVTANLNRTYLTIENFSGLYEVFYLYAVTASIDPSAVATIGEADDLLYNPTTHVLYQKQDSGTTTNWTIVQPQDVAEKLFIQQNATLEALTDVYAFINSNAPPSSPVVLGVDQGRG